MEIDPTRLNALVIHCQLSLIIYNTYFHIPKWKHYLKEVHVYIYEPAERKMVQLIIIVDKLCKQLDPDQA